MYTSCSLKSCTTIIIICWQPQVFFKKVCEMFKIILVTNNLLWMYGYYELLKIPISVLNEQTNKNYALNRFDPNFQNHTDSVLTLVSHYLIYNCTLSSYAVNCCCHLCVWHLREWSKETGIKCIHRTSSVNTTCSCVHVLVNYF